MKLYVLSYKSDLEWNSEEIEIISDDYDGLFDVGQVGQFIHEIEVKSVVKLVDAGKMAVKVR